MKKEFTNYSANFLELLFLLFLGLKLGNVIDWSWWWVFSPIWLPIVIMVIAVGVTFLGAAIAAQVSLRKNMKKGLNDTSAKK